MKKKYIGLTSWKKSPNEKILETNIVIAKNYLSKEELESLELIVSAFLDLAENRAKRHIPMTMEDWSSRIDKFLLADDLDILKDELETLDNENYDMELLGFSDSELSEILDSVSDNDGGGQVYSNKELDFSNDDFSKNITLCFDNLEDFRLVNSTLLKRDNDYAKAAIKICKEIEND